jgi:hypothetical protein
MTSIWDARRNEEREREENLKLLAGQRSVHSEGRATVASTHTERGDAAALFKDLR